MQNIIIITSDNKTTELLTGWEFNIKQEHNQHNTWFLQTVKILHQQNFLVTYCENSAIVSCNACLVLKDTETGLLNKEQWKIITQTFHTSLSKLYISQPIDVSRFLFQFESAKKANFQHANSLHGQQGYKNASKIMTIRDRSEVKLAVHSQPETIYHTWLFLLFNFVTDTMFQLHFQSPRTFLPLLSTFLQSLHLFFPQAFLPAKFMAGK